MDTYKIVHREELIGVYYVEANSVEDALAEFDYGVSEGWVDLSGLEMVDSSNEAFLEEQNRQQVQK